MRRAGKAHLITIAVLLGLAVLGVLLMFSGDNPMGAASRFMSALAKGDVDTLTKLSYYEGPKDKLREQWEFACKEAGEYYLFRWRVQTARIHGEDRAAVLTWIERNLGPSSFEEKIDLPMVKEDGAWKVDVRAIYRGMYPALPR